MMCLRDRPWLLTRTSPFAPPKFDLNITFPLEVLNNLTPVQLGADDYIVAVPSELLDCLTHDHFGLSASIATRLLAFYFCYWK